jgi:hypothetical protein
MQKQHALHDSIQMKASLANVKISLRFPNSRCDAFQRLPSDRRNGGVTTRPVRLFQAIADDYPEYYSDCCISNEPRVLLVEIASFLCTRVTKAHFSNVTVLFKEYKVMDNQFEWKSSAKYFISPDLPYPN